MIFEDDCEQIELWEYLSELSKKDQETFLRFLVLIKKLGTLLDDTRFHDLANGILSFDGNIKNSIKECDFCEEKPN